METSGSEVDGVIFDNVVDGRENGQAYTWTWVCPAHAQMLASRYPDRITDSCQGEEWLCGVKECANKGGFVFYLQDERTG